MTPPANNPAEPKEICTKAEIAKGEKIVDLPPGITEGIVTPFGAASGESLYLVTVTLPPQSCVKYRFKDGAVVLYVQKGAIEYKATPNAAVPNPVLTRGNSDGVANDAQPVPFDTVIKLKKGEWIAQDRRVWFTYRNRAQSSAVVSMAATVVINPGDPCGGGCKGH